MDQIDELSTPRILIKPVLGAGYVVAEIFMSPSSNQSHPFLDDLVQVLKNGKRVLDLLEKYPRAESWLRSLGVYLRMGDLTDLDMKDKFNANKTITFHIQLRN